MVARDIIWTTIEDGAIGRRLDAVALLLGRNVVGHHLDGRVAAEVTPVSAAQTRNISGRRLGLWVAPELGLLILGCDSSPGKRSTKVRKWMTRSSSGTGSSGFRGLTPWVRISTK